MRFTRLLAAALLLLAVLALSYSVWKGLGAENYPVVAIAPTENAAVIAAGVPNPSATTGTAVESVMASESPEMAVSEEQVLTPPIVVAPPVDVPAITPSPIEPRPMTLFYGNGCPHCANVEAYLAAHDVSAKASVTSKEVYGNEDNQRELTAQATACNIPPNQVGVPLLWTGQACLIGDVPIISYFDELIVQ